MLLDIACILFIIVVGGYLALVVMGILLTVLGDEGFNALGLLFFFGCIVYALVYMSNRGYI